MLTGLAQRTHPQVGDRLYNCDSEANPESNYIFAA